MGLSLGLDWVESNNIVFNLILNFNNIVIEPHVVPGKRSKEVRRGNARKDEREERKEQDERKRRNMGAQGTEGIKEGRK